MLHDANLVRERQDGTRRIYRVEPVRKSVHVARPVADAFRIFTQRMDAWWPFHSYSIFQRGGVDEAGTGPRRWRALTAPYSFTRVTFAPSLVSFWSIAS